MWTQDLVKLRKLFWQLHNRPRVPRPKFLMELPMPDDQKPDLLQYEMDIPAAMRRKDIVSRSMRVHIDSQLVKIDDVGLAATVYKFEVPQDSQVRLVLVHGDDAQPAPNLSFSDPYDFTATDTNPPPKPEFPYNVRLVGEVDSEAEESPATDPVSEPTEAPADPVVEPEVPVEDPVSEPTAAPEVPAEDPVSEPTAAPEVPVEDPVAEPEVPVEDPVVDESSEADPGTGEPTEEPTFPAEEPADAEPVVDEDPASTSTPAVLPEDVEPEAPADEEESV